MNGLDEGRFLAYLDDELPPAERAELEAWLEESDAAREALERVRRRADFVSGALRSLNGRAATAEAFRNVRSTVEATRRNGRNGSRGGKGGWDGWLARSRRSRLAQAATVVLLFTAAGAAAAVPGSPVRSFLASLLDRGPSEEAATMSLDVPIPEVGVRAAASDGRFDVVVSRLPDDAPLVVRLVEGDRGAVFGPEGSHFLSGTGRIEATLPAAAVPSSERTESRGPARAAPTAPVRVEIPRSATDAVLRVNGAVWLEKQGERLETPGRAARIDGDEVRFQTAGSAGATGEGSGA